MQQLEPLLLNMYTSSWPGSRILLASDNRKSTVFPPAVRENQISTVVKDWQRTAAFAELGKETLTSKEAG